MKTTEEIAAILNIDSAELEKESLKVYLERKLRTLEAERFKIARRHGISTVKDMGSSFKDGSIKEEGAWEAFFKLDYLEAEIDLVSKMSGEANEEEAV